MKEKEIFERLVESGGSKLFAGFVMRFPDSLVTRRFMKDGDGGGFYQKLWKGDFVRAIMHADSQNHKRMVTLVSEGNWVKNFSKVPAYLKAWE